jgi:hypothetical protein
MTEIAAPSPAASPFIPAPDPEAAVMIRNGITRVRPDHYEVDGYRYGNLADAIAQVTRQSRAGRKQR